MKSYKLSNVIQHLNLIKYALAQGCSMSVFSGGDGPDLSNSTDYLAIVEAVHAVDEASLRIRNAQGERIASVLVLPYLNDDETVAAWTANYAGHEWMETWSRAYKKDHLPTY